MRLGSVTIHEPLVTGAAMATCSISWVAPRPRSERGAEPLMESTGPSEWRALVSPGMALANPGVVYMATPGEPVTLAQASAMCTAAASWRVSTKRNSMSLRVSSAGRT